MPQTNLYDGRTWLETLFRSVEEFIKTGIDNYIKNGSTPVGLWAYDVVMDFPTAAEPAEKLPFKKDDKPVTLIHLAIDEIQNVPLGMGDGTYAEAVVEGDDENAGEVYPEEAEGHEVNFDIGIWATDASGGSSSRLAAYQMLNSLLGGPSAQDFFHARTGGVEIRSFNGGRFLMETVNDLRLYRVVDSELVVRVFSRKIVIPQVLVDDIDQTQGLTVGDEIIVNWQ